MTLSERLKLVMNEAGFSQGELARRAGISQGTIYKLVSGNAKSSKRIVEIAQALGVSAEWLMSGKGARYLDEKLTDNHNLPRDNFDQDSEKLEVYNSLASLNEGEVELPYLNDLDSAFETTPFPFQSHIGSTMRIDKSDLENFGVDASGSNLIIVRVTGDSMEPVIPDGSRIGIDLNDKRIVDGKLYIIDQDGWKRLRILYRTGSNELTLKSYAPDRYHDEKFELSQIKVLGRVFFSIRGM